MAEPEYPKVRNGLILEIPGARTGSGLMTSCLNCRYFCEKGDSWSGHINDPTNTRFKYAPETCTKYNMRPPARVIAFGCPAYEDEDSIPFQRLK